MPAQKGRRILPTRFDDRRRTTLRQAEAMIPRQAFQTEKRRSGTDPDDGFAVTKNAHQSSMGRRVEIDPDHR
jgi:hypothetical protein